MFTSRRQRPLDLWPALRARQVQFWVSSWRIARRHAAFRLPLCGGLPYKRLCNLLVNMLALNDLGAAGFRRRDNDRRVLPAKCRRPSTSSTDPISICSARASRKSTAARRSPTSKSYVAPRRERHGLTVEFRQSNHEGEIIDWIQQARAEKAAGLVINPAGYSHTRSRSLTRSAMEAPVIEVHISNIHAREPFRRRSYVSQVARAVVCGFGIEGYSLAIAGLAAMIDAKD